MFESFQGNPSGPAITPKTTQGGGDARPPYLQMRKPNPQPGGFWNQFQAKSPGSQPVITPKSTVVPGEVASGPKPPAMPQPPQAGGQSLADVYKFFQSDLENQKNQALAGSRTDAASRGVFYGTPLTGSEADINTQYLRGLGQFQAGMFGNQQQNDLQRQQLAIQLMGQNPQNQPSVGALDLSSLGSLFGSSPAASGKRLGPGGITPKGGKSGYGKDSKVSGNVDPTQGP